MVEIVYKNENFVVINKPVGIPSQKDTSLDADAMTQAADILKSLGEPSDLWLIHRLDRVVGGLLVFARNRAYAARLSELVQKNLLTKEYLAVVEGEPLGGEMRDFLYHDKRTNKVFVVKEGKKGAKEARLGYRVLGSVDTPEGVLSLLEITLYTGRTHQIRAQFASRRMPVYGDRRYGSPASLSQGRIALWSRSIAFTLDDDISVTSMPPIDERPWEYFSVLASAAVEEEK